MWDCTMKIIVIAAKPVMSELCLHREQKNKKLWFETIKHAENHCSICLQTWQEKKTQVLPDWSTLSCVCYFHSSIDWNIDL